MARAPNTRPSVPYAQAWPQLEAAGVTLVSKSECSAGPIYILKNALGEEGIFQPYRAHEDPRFPNDLWFPGSDVSRLLSFAGLEEVAFLATVSEGAGKAPNARDDTAK